MGKHQTLLWVLMMLWCYYQLASCNTLSNENCSVYSIHPQCYSQPCISISDFATNVSDYLHSCTHLVLQPGNHILNSPFVVSHIEEFSISTYGNLSSTYIVCVNQFVTIGYQHVDNVHTDGVTFMRCKTIVNSTKNHRLQDSNFFGNHLTGTALVSINTVSYLSNCLFAEFHGTQINNAIVGGAIITSNSTLLMHGCVFEDNRAHIGGALYLKRDCSLVLINCMFNCNSDHLSNSKYISTKGGAIYIHNGHRVTITNTTFINNTASQGGVLYLIRESMPNEYRRIVDISLSSSTFSQNSGNTGGVIYARVQNIDIYDCHFTENTARYWGGVVDSYKVNMNIYGSSFVNNTARFSGGMLYASDTNTSVYTSTFLYNIASFSGGVVYINYNSNTIISSSSFIHNSATSSGGVVYVNRNANTTINGSRFYHNSATSSGGVVYVNRNSNININGSRFCHNFANFSGGVIYVVGFANTNINNSNFCHDFASFHGGVISVNHNNNTNISNCNFTHNYASDQGGVLFAYYANTNIQNSCFTHNLAAFGGAIYLIKCNTTIEGSQQRGNLALYGGVFYAIDSNTTIVQLLLMNNSAEVVGIVVLFDGTLNISESLLIDNKAFGVLSLTGCESTLRNNIHFANNIGSLAILTSVVEFIGNNTFSNNSPLPEHITPVSEGGAMTIFQSNVKFSGITTFANNYATDGGAILAGESSIFSDGHLEIVNNSASSSGGGIYLYRSRVDVKGSCTITENRAAKKGGGINSISSSVTTQDNGLFESSITFSYNEAMLGGALHLQANSKLYTVLLNSVLHSFHFSENTAEYGAAVYIADETYGDTCVGTVEISTPTSSTDCFFQTLAFFSENIDGVDAVLNKTLNFTHNVATKAGGNLFGGLLDRCTISPVSSTRKRNHSNGIEFLSSISNINFDNLTLESISSNPVSICFCNNDDEAECNYNLPLITVKQGETFEISLVAVDHVNHPLKARISTSLSSPLSGLSEGQHSQEVSTMCTNLTFTVAAPDNVEGDTILLHAEGPCSDASKSLNYIRVRFQDCDCPIGFQRDNNQPTTCECTCHKNITSLVESCNSSTETFVRKQNSWISYVSLNQSENMSSYYLLTHLHCPYDYCTPASTRRHSKMDKICSMNRTGILCGACENGLSVSLGSSKCMKCNNYWPAVLILITLASVVSGIVLVCFILFLNMTVAVGTLNGIIFYANIIAANKSTFIRISTPNFPSVFISWLNLDIGFDVCLYDGIDTYIKTWLQLFFPSYLISLVFIVIVISKRSQQFSNIIGKRNPVAALATLILLSYAKVLSTVIKILSRTELVYPDGPRMLWLPDANVAYLNHIKHLFLFLVGIFILIVGIVYTFILFSWQWLLRLPNWKFFCWSRNAKLNLFVETYHAPYTYGYRYWTGLLLFIRVTLYLVSALNQSGDPSIPLMTTVLLVSFLLLLDKNIHKKRIVGVVESAMYFNILALAVFSWYIPVDNNQSELQTQVAATYVSIMITFTLLLSVIIYHLYQYTKLKFIMQKIGIKNLKARHFQVSRRQHLNESNNNKSSDVERDIDIFELVDSSMDTPRMKSTNVTQNIHYTLLQGI